MKITSNKNLNNKMNKDTLWDVFARKVLFLAFFFFLERFKVKIINDGMKWIQERNEYGIFGRCHRCKFHLKRR